MQLFKGGKSENTSGYSEEEGKKIDAFVAQAHAFFVKFGENLEPGMLADSIIVAAASSIGSGFKDRAAFNRNVNRMTESFRRVMTYSFDRAEARRIQSPKM
jgi:hypothetical protein